MVLTQSLPRNSDSPSFATRPGWVERISFYYQMSLAEDSPYRDVGVDFTGQEGDVTLLFHWFRIDEIEGARL